MPFVANKGQEELLDHLSHFIVSPTPRKAFILRGYAGTGKTSIMAALVGALRALQQRVVLLAPTGRAAKVLSGYAHMPAYTIHKYIYRARTKSAPSLEDSAKCLQDAALQFRGKEQFTLRDNLHKNTLFIIDEASMISGVRESSNFGSGMLLDDLVKYVYSGEGCSMLLLGDDAQLPPVGSAISPALSADYISGYGLDVSEHTLTEVARQALDSGILQNATQLRPLALEGARETDFWDILEFGEDVCTVSGDKLLEALEESYAEVGLEDTILLTRTNRRTNIYNQGIRARLLWKEDELSSGDRLMIVKNNYFWTKEYEGLPFLANGDMVEVVRLRNVREMYGYHFADAQLKLLDYDWEVDAVLWLDTLQADSSEGNQRMQRDLFEKIAEDYPELQHSRRKLIETIYESPYYNALQVRFAYAITGHKSQGGQWARVFIDPYKGGVQTGDKARGERAPQNATSIFGDPAEARGEDMKSFYRWLYTALTRAREKVYFIKNG